MSSSVSAIIASPTLTLKGGVAMPALGLGVFQSSPKQTGDAVESALKAGYRLIDTAAAYQNEKQVGEGIRRSGVDRSEIFVTTKLWVTNYGYDSALRAFDVSLRKLGLDYLDLYLLHWPVPSDFDRTVRSYQAAEKLLADGRVRAIGVCNFGPKHLENLVSRTEAVPSVNQVELNPFFTQHAVRDADGKYGIVTQSWSPIGGVNFYWSSDPDAAKNPLRHPVVLKMAEQHRKTPAQIILRWHLEHGLSAIPKSVRPARIAENIDIFDFSLTPNEVAALDNLDTGVRGGPDPEVFSSATARVTIEDELGS